MNKFQRKLLKIQEKNNSLVCVGLDTDLEKIPKHLLDKADSIFTFNKAIIDTTTDLVCAYKPNIAFYEAQGISGLKSLKKTIDYLRKKYSEIPIILDAKRADIDSTNLGYIKMAFEFLQVDAITLHPYLGKQALMPFLTLKDKFFFILCRTSNPGAGEFQDLRVAPNLKLYQYLAKKVTKEWNFNHNCGLVVSATYPEELVKIRKIAGKMIFLIPGVGVQGADVEKTVKAAQSGNFLINSSRGIIYASSGRDFAQKAREETVKLRNLINKYR